MKDDYKWFEDVFWISVRAIVGFFLILVGVALLIFLCGCDSKLKKENEMLREELAKAQQYVPLQRDTIRDTVEVVTQKVVEVERIKEVLTKDDKALLKDLNAKVSALESYQKIGTMTEAEVVLGRDSIATDGTGEHEEKEDSIFTFKDAWLDLKYNNKNNILVIRLQDSLAISVEREYRKKFLWWKWGVKGYQVKAVSFSPYSTIRYNTFVKRRR